MPGLIPDLPCSPTELELWIEDQENNAPAIKESARAGIVWADPGKKNKTEFSLVYLHGFKASHREGHPIHRQVAQSIGCNLYLSRLEGHGLDIKKPLLDLSASSFEASDRKALAIGEKIGEKVIIMGTSTGASLGLLLAGQSETSKNIAALILYSPLVKFYGYSQWLLGNRFTRAVLKIIPGKKYMLSATPGSIDAEKEIWYHRYALQGVLALGEFVQKNMTTSTFANVTCPVFIGYYYKNEREQDKVVSVAAIKKMFTKLGTKPGKKILRNFPESRTHVIGSGLISGSTENVKNETIRFLSSILAINEM